MRNPISQASFFHLEILLISPFRFFYYYYYYFGFFLLGNKWRPLVQIEIAPDG